MVWVPDSTTILLLGEGSGDVDFTAQLGWGRAKLSMNAPNLSLGGVADIINVSTPSQIVRKGDTEIFD